MREGGRQTCMTSNATQMPHYIIPCRQAQTQGGQQKTISVAIWHFFNFGGGRASHINCNSKKRHALNTKRDVWSEHMYTWVHLDTLRCTSHLRATLLLWHYFLVISPTCYGPLPSIRDLIHLSLLPSSTLLGTNAERKGQEKKEGEIGSLPLPRPWPKDPCASLWKGCEIITFRAWKRYVETMSYGKWRDTKQQPGRGKSSHRISCCLASLCPVHDLVDWNEF